MAYSSRTAILLFCQNSLPHVLWNHFEPSRPPKPMLPHASVNIVYSWCFILELLSILNSFLQAPSVKKLVQISSSLRLFGEILRTLCFSVDKSLVRDSHRLLMWALPATMTLDMWHRVPRTDCHFYTLCWSWERNWLIIFLVYLALSSVRNSICSLAPIPISKKVRVYVGPMVYSLASGIPKCWVRFSKLLRGSVETCFVFDSSRKSFK